MFDYNLFTKRLSNSKLYKTSFIKNEVAKRLLKRLDFINLEPKNILVLGYSDEEYLDKLRLRFADANIHTNVQNNSFDIIISNSNIHLTDNITDELDRLYEMLNDDGVLLFSSFGERSFSTLNKAFASIDNLPHTNGMIDAMSWGGVLQSSRYYTPAIESDVINFTYEKVDTLFNDIRELNEPLADTKMQSTLTGKNKWQKFIQELNKNLKLEVEALYGYAVRKETPEPTKKENSSTRMSIDDLKKQIADFKKGL